METQGFIQYLKNTIADTLRQYETNLLNASYEKHDQTQRAAGVREALSGVIQGIDNIFTSYLNQKNNPSLNSVSNADASSDTGDN